MCARCGPETIHHVAGQRPVDREWCWCECHDEWTDDGRVRTGAERGDETAARLACPNCRWAHCVAFSTADWRHDERYMRGPLRPVEVAAHG